RDEGVSRIVDQHVKRCLAPDALHHGIDRCTVADVASNRGDLAAQLAAQRGRRRLQHLAPAATDKELGAKLHKAPSHGGAKSAATTGDENALSLKQVFFKHSFIPLQAPARFGFDICSDSSQQVCSECQSKASASGASMKAILCSQY